MVSTVTPRVGVSARVEGFVPPGGWDMAGGNSWWRLASRPAATDAPMLKRVYIETTIPSFYYNQRSGADMVARMNWTCERWDEHRVAYDVVSSTAVVDELMRQDHPKQTEKLSLLAPLRLLEPSPEVLEIVEVYVARKVMPADPLGDALHLALASHYGCDVLLTWNCVHLANANKFGHIQRVNALLGLPMPWLVTPLELLESPEGDED
jgi:predicted nucleic acid-binding protein